MEVARVVSQPIAVEQSLQVSGVTYSIMSLIGEGSRGTRVFLASISPPRGDITKAALKCIPFHSAHQEERMKVEANLLSAVRHKNVIRLVGPPFIHMALGFSHVVIPLESCSGGSLRQRLASTGPILIERVASQILRQILQGLSVLHQNNIIHRDLKPENVLLHEDGTIRIADLGIASREELLGSDSLSAITQSRTPQAGTMPYMAPEQFSCVYGPKVDLWAIGIIILDMALGLQWNASNPSLGLQAELSWQVAARRIPAALGRVQTLASKLLRTETERLNAESALREIPPDQSAAQVVVGNDPFLNVEQNLFHDATQRRPERPRDPFALLRSP